MMKKTSAGLSFVEIVVAMFVLGLAIVPIFGVFSRGTVGTIQSRDEVLAYHAAAELLDWAQTKQYSDADLAMCDHKPFPQLVFKQTGGEMVTTTVDSTRFERFLSAKEFSPSGRNPFVYKVLTAEVVWKSGEVQRKIHMTNILFKGR